MGSPKDEATGPLVTPLDVAAGFTALPGPWSALSGPLSYLASRERDLLAERAKAEVEAGALAEQRIAAPVLPLPSPALPTSSAQVQSKPALDRSRMSEMDRALYDAGKLRLPTASRTTTVTPGLYTPAQAAAGDAALERQIAGVRQAEAEKLQAIAQTKAALGSIRSTLEQQTAGAKEGKAEAGGRLDFARTALDERERDVEALSAVQGDQGYWQRKGAFARVLSALAVGLGGFAEGYSGGRVQNTALKILDGAMARDAAANRARLEVALRRSGAAQAEVDKALRRFDAAQKDERDLSYRVAQISLSQAAAESQRSEAKLEAANTIGTIERQRLELLGKSRARVATHTTTGTDIVDIAPKAGAVAAPTGLPPAEFKGDDAKKYDAAIAFPQKVADLAGHVRRQQLQALFGDTTVGRMATTASALVGGAQPFIKTDASQVDAERRDVAVINVQARSGAAFTEAEVETQNSRTPNLAASPAQNQKAMTLLVGDQLRAIDAGVAKAKAEGKLGNLAAWMRAREETLAAYREGLRRLGAQTLGELAIDSRDPVAAERQAVRQALQRPAPAR
jgi:hypothetical protein